MQTHRQGDLRRKSAILLVRVDGNAFVGLAIESRNAHGAKPVPEHLKHCVERLQEVANEALRFAQRGRRWHRWVL